MIDEQIEDGIHILRVTNGENRFNPDSIAAWNAALDRVERKEPRALSMAAIVRARVPQPAAHEAMMTGRRYTAEEAQRAGIVHATAPEHEVLPRAIELARKYGGKPAETLASVKRTTYHDVVAALAREAQRAPER